GSGAEIDEGGLRAGELWNGAAGAGYRGGRCDHGCAASCQRYFEDFRYAKDKNKECGEFGFRALGDCEEGSAAADDRRRVVRPHPVGSQPTYPVRYRGREPELPTAGIDGFADGRAAGSGKERQIFEKPQRVGRGGEARGGGR